MKWLGRIFYLRHKQIISQPALWVMLVITLLASLVPITRWQGVDKRVPIGVVDLDGGSYAAEFITYLEEEPTFRLETLEEKKALKKLAGGSLEGVLVLEDNFSDELENMEFSNILTIYVSPSSSIAQLLSEVFSEKIFEMWAVEVMVADMVNFQEEMGQDMPPNYEDRLRADMQAASRSNPLVTVDLYWREEEFTAGLDSLLTVDEEELPIITYSQGLLWYCAFIVIFILVSSRWVIDQRRTALGDRMRALGILPAWASLASALAVTLVCLVGLLVCVGLSVALLPLTLLDGLWLAGLGLLYLLAIIGLSICLSSLLRESLNLLLIAPMLALLNAVLGGMLAELPAWAAILSWLTGVFPGRLLSLAIAGEGTWPLALAAGVYLGLGVLLAALTTGVDQREE